MGLVKTFNTHYPLPQALAGWPLDRFSSLHQLSNPDLAKPILPQKSPSWRKRVKVQICKLTQLASSFTVQSLHQIWRELVFRLHKLKLTPWGRLSLKYCLPTLGHCGNQLTDLEDHPRTYYRTGNQLSVDLIGISVLIFSA